MEREVICPPCPEVLDFAALALGLRGLVSGLVGLLVRKLWE